MKNGINADKICFYCKTPISFNYEYYVIKEAIKPPFASKRWKNIGYACDTCIDQLECKATFDRFKSLINIHNTFHFDVYIGRGSIWGNPFKITNTQSRGKCIKLYKKYLWEKINSKQIQLTDLAALNNKKLGCYCLPFACHGDILIKAAAWAKYTIHKNKK